MTDIRCIFNFVRIETKFPTLLQHTMAMKRCMEDYETERQLIDSDSDNCSELEDNGWDYEDKDDEELERPPLSSLSSSPWC